MVCIICCSAIRRADHIQSCLIDALSTARDLIGDQQQTATDVRYIA